jgi:ribosomal protein S18 acetylase RimI-like enzyme
MLARMILIRPAEPADALGIAQVRAAAWEAAYAGMITAERLAEVTTPDAVAREAQWRAAHPMDGYLVARDPPGDIIGFAWLGPERGEDDVPGEPLAGPPEQDRAELYAIYVLPGRWSGGAGQALLDHALALAADAGYADISTWVLEANARGRRFYERAGFRVTGESAGLARLGGITEVRYRRVVG